MFRHIRLVSRNVSILRRFSASEQAAAVPSVPASTNPTPSTPAVDLVNIDEFAKVHLVVGEIKSAEPIKSSKKLLKLSVDMGSYGTRTVLAGIAKAHPEPAATLITKKAVFVANLPERKMGDNVSQGMILCAADGNSIQFLTPSGDAIIPNGTRIS